MSVQRCAKTEDLIIISSSSFSFLSFFGVRLSSKLIFFLACVPFSICALSAASIQNQKRMCVLLIPVLLTNKMKYSHQLNSVCSFLFIAQRFALFFQWVFERKPQKSWAHSKPLKRLTCNHSGEPLI